MTLKSWWANPRLKGVVQLLFWIVFFALVAILFRTGKSDDEVTKDGVSINKNDVISYEYNYKYQDGINSIVVSGTHYDNKEKFAINGSKFYYVDGNYYDELANSITKIDYPLNEWNYNNIKSITDHNNYSNVTKYKSGDSKYEYIISSNIYNNYYGSAYTNNIIVTITKNSDDFITKASINYGIGSVNIEYININEIERLDINNR